MEVYSLVLDPIYRPETGKVNHSAEDAFPAGKGKVPDDYPNPRGCIVAKSKFTAYDNAFAPAHAPGVMTEIGPCLEKVARDIVKQNPTTIMLHNFPVGTISNFPTMEAAYAFNLGDSTLAKFVYRLNGLHRKNGHAEPYNYEVMLKMAFGGKKTPLKSNTNYVASVIIYKKTGASTPLPQELLRVRMYQNKAVDINKYFVTEVIPITPASPDSPAKYLMEQLGIFQRDFQLHAIPTYPDLFTNRSSIAVKFKHGNIYICIKHNDNNVNLEDPDVRSKWGKTEWNTALVAQTCQFMKDYADRYKYKITGAIYFSLLTNCGTGDLAVPPQYNTTFQRSGFEDTTSETATMLTERFSEQPNGAETRKLYDKWLAQTDAINWMHFLYKWDGGALQSGTPLNQKVLSTMYSPLTL